MTQVWMLRNSDTDVHLFARREHLEPSVSISYSTCKHVKIVQQAGSEYPADTVAYRVTGARDDSGWFDELVIFRRYPVWTEPSHL